MYEKKVPTKFPYELNSNAVGTTNTVASQPTRQKVKTIYCSIIGHTAIIKNEKDVTKSVIDLNCVRAISPVTQYKDSDSGDIISRIKVYVTVTDFIQVSSRSRVDVIEISNRLVDFIEKAAKASAEERKRLLEE